MCVINYMVFFFHPSLSSLPVAIGSDEARLVILPDGGNIVRPVGANIVLTCKGEVPDPDLISDLRWLGPDGRDLPNGDRYDDDAHSVSLILYANHLSLPSDDHPPPKVNLSHRSCHLFHLFPPLYPP